MFDYKCPREIAFPRRVMANTKQEFIDYINRNIGISDIYTTVYFHSKTNGGGRLEYSSAIINKLYLDCDWKAKDPKTGKMVETDGYNAMLKLHEWCCKRDIMHLCCMTGSAYNIYIATSEEELQNKSGAVYNAQTYLCSKLGIITDSQVLGDLARVSRIPNTYNFKPAARRFCIPLKEDQLYIGHEKIKELAQKQQFGVAPIGNKRWSIKRFDTAPAKKRILLDINIDLSKEIDADMVHGAAPECVKQMIANTELGNKERIFLITWLRDSGYLAGETSAILKKYLSPRKYRHSVFEEHQIHDVYGKGMMLFFPRCDTLQARGLCNNGGNCNDRNNHKDR